MIENSGKQTEILHRQILMHRGIEEHPIGHTDKVYRYRTHLGHEFAVEKRRRNPILLVSASAVQVVPPSLPLTTVTAGRNGRNSNLNALPTLRDRPLLRLEVGSMADANLLLQSLG
jgi:hypothetical protein